MNYQLSIEDSQQNLSHGKNEFLEISTIAYKAPEPEYHAELSRTQNEIETAKVIYEELIIRLIPKSKELCVRSHNKCFACFTCGLVFRVAGMNEGTIDMYKLSLNISPIISNTLLEITRCLGEIAQNAEALTYVKKAVHVAPQSAAAWGNFAMSLIQIRDRENAVEAIYKATDIDLADPKNNYILRSFDRYFAVTNRS